MELTGYLEVGLARKRAGWESRKFAHGPEAHGVLGRIVLMVDLSVQALACDKLFAYTVPHCEALQD